VAGACGVAGAAGAAAAGCCARTGMAAARKAKIEKTKPFDIKKLPEAHLYLKPLLY